MRVKHLIVGGGIAGLTLGMELKSHYTMLEASSIPGGLCRSWQDAAGYWHDYGPHIFNYAGGFDWFRSIMPNCKELPRRDECVLTDGSVVQYPVQTSCKHLVDARPDMDVVNYSDHCMATYGQALCDLFFEPYNRKFYGCDTTLIDKSVAGRTPVVGAGPGTYLYPDAGNFGVIPQAMAKRCYIRYGMAVDHVDPIRHSVVAGDETFQYDVLIWAAPIRTLIKLLHWDYDIPALDLNLVTQRIDVKPEYEYLAQYNALPGHGHRYSMESVLKGNGDQFMQYEANVPHDHVDAIPNCDSCFTIPDAYIMPTVKWLKTQKDIKQRAEDVDIMLHGRAGNGIHINVWGIAQASKALASKLH